MLGNGRLEGECTGGHDFSAAAVSSMLFPAQRTAHCSLPLLHLSSSSRPPGHCFDGQTRLCHIRGKMRKKVWVNQGDIILIGLRDYQDAKADVILKYTSDEARRLKSQGELPDHTQINVADKIGEGDDEDIPFDFEEI